jgi:uncharacterized protein YndB with AHSA1/START domain
MVTMQETFTIDRPVEEVFDYLADVRNELEWNPTIRSAQKVTEGPIRTGTRFIGDYRPLGRATIDIVEMDRPLSIRFLATWTRLSFDGAFTLAQAGTGTVVHVTLVLQPRGVLKLLFPLIARQVARQMRSHGPLMGSALEARDQGSRSLQRSPAQS